VLSVLTSRLRLRFVRKSVQTASLTPGGKAQGRGEEPLGSELFLRGGGGGGGALPSACATAHPFAGAFASDVLLFSNGLECQRASAAALFLALFSSTHRRSFVSRFCSQPFSVSIQKDSTVGFRLIHFFAVMPSIWAMRLSSFGSAQLGERQAMSSSRW
jgi:hypothetical protein